MYLFNYEETVIVSAECLNCPHPKYDPAYSVKHTELENPWIDTLEVPMKSEEVIRASCRGIRDKICMDYDFCSEGGDKDYIFLIVTKYTGTNKIGVFPEDGMIGLTPNPNTLIESLPEYLARS